MAATEDFQNLETHHSCGISVERLVVHRSQTSVLAIDTSNDEQLVTLAHDCWIGLRCQEKGWEERGGRIDDKSNHVICDDSDNPENAPPFPPWKF